MSMNGGELYDSGFEAGKALGDEDGYQRGLKEILDWLQKKYITDEGRPDRNSLEGQAILDVARDANRHIKALQS